jgi:type IV pilus assembly protein PilO
MNLEELKNLDPKNLGAWPIGVKAGALALILVAILVLGYFADWSGQWDELRTAQAKEEELKNTYKGKKALAVNLDAYKQRLAEIDRAFGTLLKQLPNRAEMDGLISDINQAGLGRGLQFELFRPAAGETMSEFYAELPITIRVIGNYHDLGGFASDIGKLSRIVLLQDIAITGGKEKDSPLTMDAVAKTYRYLDEQEIATQQKAAKGGKDKGQKK